MKNNISCVILNFNDAPTVVKLINHICNFNSINHIIVVDNNSTDDSVKILQKNISTKVSLIQTECNGGYGYGNNYGINYAIDKFSSSHIIIANPDVLFTEDTVLKLHEALKSDEKNAVAAPTPMLSSHTFQPYPAWKILSAWREVLCSSIFLSKIIPDARKYKFETNENDAYVEAVQGSLLMVDSKVMSEIGMYDEDFFLYFEEQVLSKKITDHGYRTILLLHETYLHLHSVSISKTYSSMLQKKRIYLASKLLFIEKYHSVSKLFLLFSKIFMKAVLFESLIIPFLIKLKKQKI